MVSIVRLIWLGKMSSLFRQSLGYVPKAQQSMLSAQRQINHAVAPYVMGGEQDWRSLSFLLNADTADLTQSLGIPSDLTVEQIDVLIDFAVRRGNRPFDSIDAKGEDLIKIDQRIRERGLDVSIQAFKYYVVCDPASRNPGISFPDFTTEINLEDGELLNLPSKIVKLTLFFSIFRDTEALERAQYLKSISIASEGDFILRGLPQYLEHLQIRDVVNYEEGHHYDCPYLKTLTSILPIDAFPKDFIDSISNSLLELEIVELLPVSYHLADILRKLVKLEKLTLEGVELDDFDFSSLPPWLKEFELHDRDFKPLEHPLSLPSLLKLTITYTDGLFGVLKGLPNLEELDLHNPIARAQETTRQYLVRRARKLLTGSFPSVKKLKLRGGHLEEYLDLSDAKSLFPNLVEYNSRDFLAQDIKANFVAKEISYTFKFDKTTENIQLTKALTDFDKFTFDCSTIKYKLTRGQRKLTANLPSTTKRLSFIVDGKNHEYVIDDVFGLDSDSRQRLFESITFNLEVTAKNVTAKIELVAKQNVQTLYDSRQ